VIGDYIAVALSRATFEKLEDGTVYAEVPELQGVWANADTEEETRAELAEVVEEWVLLRISQGLPVPNIAGVGVRAPA
jgi:predicted RNase H-like HicB family nuclease